MSFKNKMKTVGRFLIKICSFPFVEHQATYNIVIALVTALTLVWAAMTYHLLDQRERARTELYEIKERIRNSESTTVQIQTQFIKTQKSKKSESGYYIYPTVTIKNVGKDKIVLNLENDALTIDKVKIVGDKTISEETYQPSYYEKISSDIQTASKRLKVIEIPVDGERSIPYAIKVKSSGFYYITFSARPYYKDEARAVDNHELVWFAAEYKDIR